MSDLTWWASSESRAVRLNVMLYKGSVTMQFSPIRAKLFASDPTGYVATSAVTVTIIIIIHWLQQLLAMWEDGTIADSGCCRHPFGVAIDFLLRPVVDMFLSLTTLTGLCAGC